VTLSNFALLPQILRIMSCCTQDLFPLCVFRHKAKEHFLSIKFTLEQTMQTQRGSRGTAVLLAISGFRREVDENCALLGCYAASSGNLLPTFWDNLSVPYSRVKNPKKMGRICFPEMSERNYHYSLHNSPE